MKYEPIQTDKYEWDNIPPVIQKMLIYMEKYIEGFADIFLQQS